MKKPNANRGLAMDIFRDRIGFLKWLKDMCGLNPEEMADLERREKELARLEGEVKAETSEEVSHRVKRARQRGTNAERACAKATGGVVVGRSKAVKLGDKYVQVNCQQPPDVLSPPFFSFEVKNTPIPKKISKAMSQSIQNAPQGFTPEVWWYDRDTGETYVITIKPHWLDLHGGNNKPSKAENKGDE